jgi:asparagine synthetase B (glutamine-hydrolysing)
MCGICGFVLKELMEPVEITKAIERMTQTLHYCGPDGQGIRVISPPLVPQSCSLGAPPIGNYRPVGIRRTTDE